MSISPIARVTFLAEVDADLLVRDSMLVLERSVDAAATGSGDRDLPVDVLAPFDEPNL